MSTRTVALTAATIVVIIAVITALNIFRSTWIDRPTRSKIIDVLLVSVVSGLLFVVTYVSVFLGVF